MDARDPNHSVHRIVLPSGRTIEVVRFGEGSPPAETRPLHVCPSCSSELVQPTDWSETDDGRWELQLCCPNCRWTGDGIFEQIAVEEFEERLDEGLEAIITDLQRLTRANMSEEIDRFVAALHADLILPEDF